MLAFQLLIWFQRLEILGLFKEAKYKAHGAMLMRLENYKYAACAAIWLHKNAISLV
jgi:hypothetical protein